MYPEEREKIIQAKQIISQKFAEKLTIENLAKSVGLSETKFKTCFRKFSGQSPRQYIIQVRIVQAQKLLKQSELSISEIAITVGYNSLSHFTDIFKKISGSLPSDYRKANF